MKNNMKGHLYKKIQPEGWYVAYTEDSFGFRKTELPLHPKDVELMPLRGQLPNDQHVMDGMEVEFNMVKEWIDSHTNQVQAYAKLNENFKQFSLYEHKETITSADTSQMIFGEHQITVLEISDEEIAKQGFLHSYANELPDENAISFIQGAEWYRERLKQLNEK